MEQRCGGWGGAQEEEDNQIGLPARPPPGTYSDSDHWGIFRAEREGLAPTQRPATPGIVLKRQKKSFSHRPTYVYLSEKLHPLDSSVHGLTVRPGIEWEEEESEEEEEDGSGENERQSSR